MASITSRSAGGSQHAAGAWWVSVVRVRGIIAASCACALRGLVGAHLGEVVGGERAAARLGAPGAAEDLEAAAQRAVDAGGHGAADVLALDRDRALDVGEIDVAQQADLAVADRLGAA